MLKISNILGGYILDKKEEIKYTVEREFLSKFSKEELLVRIVKSHLDIEINKRRRR